MSCPVPAPRSLSVGLDLGTGSAMSEQEWIWKREVRLRRLGYPDYQSYIGSPEWASTRSRYWEDPDTLKTCAVCGTTEALALHHRTYDRVGAEHLDDLTPACPNCHRLIHELVRRGDLNGLDADLTILRNPGRAAQNRAATLEPQAKRATKQATDVRRRRALARAEDKVEAARRVVRREQHRGNSLDLAQTHLANAIRRRNRVAAR